MYGIPENLDLTTLVGDRLDSITIEEYQIAFQFDRGTSLVVEGGMVVSIKGNAAARWKQKEGWSSIDFQKCVGATVESFAVVSKSELDLYLTGDVVLRFFDDSPQYESFHIYPQDIHI